MTEKPALRERLERGLLRLQFVFYLVLVLFLIGLGFLWPRMFILIPSGHRGVLFRYFGGGTATDRVWAEGLNIIAPWDTLTAYEIRLQAQTLKFDVLSEEGLNLGIEVSVRFRPEQRNLGHLHEDIGTDYFNRLVKPEIQSHVRRTFGTRPAHEIYASARDILQELSRIPMLVRLDTPNGQPGEPYVQIQELKLVDIELPAVVEKAIAEKYRQEQLMLEYRYKLEREEKEAERKRTEAAGIRDYNQIAGRVSPDLLRWRGIEATTELAKSNNAKVIMLGGGQGSTPMLMNIGDSPSSDTAKDTAKDITKDTAKAATPKAATPKAATPPAPPPPTPPPPTPPPPTPPQPVPPPPR